MAILFDDASTEYLQVDSAPFTGQPIAMSTWAYPDVSRSHSPLFMGDASVTGNRAYISLRVTSDFSRWTFDGSGTSVNIDSGNTVNLNAWNHCYGSSAALNDHISVLNGDWANRGTSTTTAGSATGWDRVTIGRLGDSTPNFEFSGRIAECAIWNEAHFTQGEVEALAAGISPLLVRPHALVFHQRMLNTSDLIDRVGGLSLTAFNTPVNAEHPPMIYPAAPLIMHAPAAVAAVVQIQASKLAQQGVGI